MYILCIVFSAHIGLQNDLTHSWTVLSTYQSVGIYKRKHEVKKERNTLLTKKANKKKNYDYGQEKKRENTLSTKSFKKNFIFS